MLVCGERGVFGTLQECRSEVGPAESQGIMTMCERSQAKADGRCS